jgi:transposase InsO family protein
MTEAEIEVILQRAREGPEAKPRIISDNGPQFIARKFKEFISIAGMTHDRSSCLENSHFAEEESSLTKNVTSHLGLSQPTLGRGK